MPKYTEAPAAIPEARWLKRIANEMAENNRHWRKFFRLTGAMADHDTSTQNDNAGS